VQPGADLAATRGFVADALGRLRDETRRYPVELWVESHGDFARSAVLRDLLEAAGAATADALWDPANAFMEGEAPDAGYALLAPRIRHVHLKDVRRQAGAWIPVLTGTGEFPVARALSLLHEGGYTGWLSFEWEKRWHPQIEEPEIALPHFAQWARRSLEGGTP
jgi:sugar phosphate isomerase/epimerase